MNPNEPDQPGRIYRNDSRLRRMVPLTELRHFYHLLRKTLVSTAVHLCIAEEIRRNVNNFQNLVECSRTHFRLYDNRGEGFHPRQPPGTLLPDVLESPLPVHQLLRRVAQHGISVPDHPELDANYVDYQVSPIRTIDSEYENGVRCLARGGVDILMANARDRLPVVVELKGEGDTNIFFALIQALTYAVELSTPSQQERMDRTYPGQFTSPPDGPVLDIYLLLVGTPKNSDHPNFLCLVDEICRQLLTPGTSVASMVRRIVCLETNEPDAAVTPFEVLFIHP